SGLLPYTSLFRSFIVEALYINSAETFRCFFNFKFNGFIIFKTLIIVKVFDIIAVNKNVIAAIIGLNKTKSFFCVKKPYFSLCHIVLCVFIHLWASSDERS